MMPHKIRVSELANYRYKTRIKLATELLPTELTRGLNSVTIVKVLRTTAKIMHKLFRAM